jgi:SAM-dependent methyltransferase
MNEPGEPSEPSLCELLAWSMDAEPALLPYLPRIFADMEELGARSEEVLQILRPVGLPAGARVLDLGCGKGAVSLALVAEFDCVLHAIDGMPEFIEHAERRAEAMGVGDQCVFAEGDVRDAAVQSRDYDLVCLLALGDILGTARETVATLRECVKPGGLILIDDAYLRDGEAPPEDVVNCFDHTTTLEGLGASGDQVLAELIVDGPDSEAHYRAMTANIAERVAALVAAHPEDAELLEGYVRRQQEEVEVLTGPLVGALWLIRRAEITVDPAGRPTSAG